MFEDQIKQAGVEAAKIEDKLDATVDDGIARLIAGGHELLAALEALGIKKKLVVKNTNTFEITLEDR